MPELGFGTATLGRETNEHDSFAILDAAYGVGFRHFDTAEAYGGGNARFYRRTTLGVDDVRESTGTMHSSELLLGEWMKSRGVRHQVKIATKVSSGFRAPDVTAALSRSLERLQLDQVDLYYLHSMPPGDMSLAEPMSALEEARLQGLTKSIGVCNCTLPQLAEAYAAAPTLDHCQSPFNLIQRESQTLWPFCQTNAIRFVGYSPLAAGFLTGKYGARGNAVPPGTRFHVIPGHQSIYFREESYQTLAHLESASARTALAKPLLALAWTLRHAAVAIVLVGATRPEHLTNAVQAKQLAGDDELFAHAFAPEG